MNLFSKTNITLFIVVILAILLSDWVKSLLDSIIPSG